MPGRVVVGVDGSEESRNALRWAAQDAQRRGAELQVVYVHRPRLDASPYELSYAYTSSPRPLIEERRRHEHERLASLQEAETLMDELVQDLPAELREVSIQRVARESSRPARTLLEAARNADLLVVGSRGRGGFKGLLLGSVSQQLAQHATCPLVIVHGPEIVLDLAVV